MASTPQVALVYTLAVGKDDKAGDAYKEENERAASAMAEAESVAVRSTTPLNPTEEDETPNVLRARLFETVDLQGATDVIAAYSQVWNANRETLPADATDSELREQFAKSYPLHPKLLEMLTEKTASLSTFQRTRGMLRLLARTVHHLWRIQPADAYSIHAHHLDPAFEPIRTEVNVKLMQGQYAPAVKSDVVAGDEPALAQRIDAQKYPGLPPVTAYLARTIFWHTLAYGESAKGISAEQLKLSVCSPSIEPPFSEQARLQFIADSIYLDDRPGAPLRFIATVLTPHSWSHLACRCRSSVKQPKLHTGCASRSGPTAAKCSPLPISIPAASRCTTSKPGLTDQIRRPRSFFCFRVSREPLFDSAFVSFAIFFLSPSCCWRGAARSRFTTYSLQRGQDASFEAAATKLMIDRTGARLYHGQERANVTSAITCDAFAALFLPQAGPAPQVVSGSHDGHRTSRTLSEQKWSSSRERRGLSPPRGNAVAICVSVGNTGNTDRHESSSTADRVEIKWDGYDRHPSSPC